MPDGQKLSEEHKRAVKMLCVENPNAKVSRIHALLNEDTRFRTLPRISNRSVRNIMDAIKKSIKLPSNAGEKYDPSELFPSERVPMHQPMWDEEIDGRPLTTAEKSFLLKLDEVSKVVEGLRLFVHERKWACRIYLLLSGLTWLEIYRFVKLYGMRELIAHMDNEHIYTVQGVRISNLDIYTADLDGVLAYSPWLSARAEKAYESAVEAKTIPAYWTYIDDSHRKARPSHWQIVQEALYANVDQVLNIAEANDGLDLLQKYWDGDLSEGELK